MKKTKHVYLYLAASLTLFTLLLAGMSTAQTVNNQHAVVDVERVLRESAAGKAIMEEVEVIRNRGQKEIEQYQERAKSIRQRLQEGALSMSEQEQQRLNDEMRNLQITMQRRTDDLTRELNKLREQRLGEFERMVFPVINTYAQELGFSMVFNKFSSGLVYVDDQLDITEQIIFRLNMQ